MGEMEGQMSDTDRMQPMTDADVTPATSTDFQPADPIKGATLEPESAAAPQSAIRKEASALRQSLVDKAGEVRGQAGEKARAYAEDGKAKATSALGELSKMLTDAAGSVDEKLGDQYGQYARDAADRVQGFSSAIDEKSLDELLDMGRDFVRKSPAVAIGVAAALGFVAARLLTAGLDQRDAA
jgi:ElaB/YqjD/DUF883 family membrane-anchored ribosome-binding protein